MLKAAELTPLISSYVLSFNVIFEGRNNVFRRYRHYYNMSGFFLVTPETVPQKPNHRLIFRRTSDSHLNPSKRRINHINFKLKGKSLLGKSYYERNYDCTLCPFGRYA